MPRLTPDERNELKELVLLACHAILDSGHVPSERQLRERFPDRGVDLLVSLRDELRYCGRLPWSPDPNRSRCSREAFRRPPHKPAVDAAGRKPWEQRVWMQCRIRAVKMARGEPIPSRVPLSRREECRGAWIETED